MDRKTINEIIGRAATDAAFRRALIADPRKALTDAGYPVDANFLALLNPAHLQELDTMASEYEKRFLGGNNVHAVVGSASGAAPAPSAAPRPSAAPAPSASSVAGGPVVPGGSGGSGSPGGSPPPMG
ncbi:MAG TPA: Os1348 family NHLP clan protein [Archangium sp.]|nr:Os1348 family NHLP clan protein [Archangium sp.]